MNPYRYGNQFCHKGGCSDLICLFDHMTGKQIPESIIRIAEKHGQVRCTKEWEITTTERQKCTGK